MTAFPRAPARLVLAVWLYLTGCGRYAEFRLPPPPSDPPGRPARWQAATEPVLTRGPAGEWDAVDVLNPSVVRFHGIYYNVYSGFDGKTWHTGVATSADGVAWNKQGRVLRPEGWEGAYIAANGSTLAVGEEILYWYQAGAPPRIGLARSRDGRMWDKRPGPVMEPGPRGSWDERGVADPYVIRAGGDFYVYFLGLDRPRRQRLGVARSRDGVHWEKLTSNPVLDLGAPGAFDEAGLGEPAVWAAGGFYWMLYTGRDRAERRRIGLARSLDGVHWQREPLVISGERPWNSHVVCDPAVEVSPNGVRVWFGGGDVAHPAENIHGQIGVGFLAAKQGQ